MAGRLNWTLAAAAAVAGTAIFFVTGGSYESVTPRVTPEMETVPEPEREGIAPATPLRADSPQPPPAAMTREVPGDPGEPPMLPALALDKGELPWERRMREVTGNSAIPDSDKARLLLDLLPLLPVEGRQTAAEEAIKLLPDQDYRYAQAVLLNPNTYPPALAVLWSDLMERPPGVTLPALLQVARNSAHPYAPNAVENLEMLTGQNHGSDWPRWEAAVREKLGNK